MIVEGEALGQLDDYHQRIAMSDYELRLLGLLLKLHGAKNLLELGTLVGTSAIAMAQLVPGLFITSVEADAHKFEIAKQNILNCKLEERISLVHADALEYVGSLPDSSFDALFIDANKKAYPKYFHQAQRLLRGGGLLIADNTLLAGKILDEGNSYQKNMHAFNELVAKHMDSIIITTNEGLTIGIKNG